MYFVFIDAVVLLQFLYYQFIYRPLQRWSAHNTPLLSTPASTPASTPPRSRSASVSVSVEPTWKTPLGMTLLFILFACIVTWSYSTPPYSGSEHTPLSYLIGVWSAWICAGLYLTSRLPQIYHNYKRGSFEGLSIIMFMCAAMGNATYTASVLLRSQEPAFLIKALPYLLGSGGTLVFDFIIFGQWIYYGRRQRPSEEDEDLLFDVAEQQWEETRE